MTSTNHPDEVGLLRRAGRLAARAGSAVARRLGETAEAEQIEPPQEPLRVAMKELLDSSAAFDVEQAREDLYATVLRQLTPDEARILSALATGAEFPAVDVMAGGRMLLRQSTVGDATGVTLPDEVPSYLARLVGLGLIDIEGESTGLEPQYEILATDDLVREALSTAKRPKQLRRTVHISRFGARFWSAADPATTRVR